jgi:hypothetical protein
MSRAVIQMTIEDAEHYTPDQRTEIVSAYPEHEREARTKGIPALGSGRVFPVTEEAILCDPVQIPPHWPQINGLDFGWDHPFAAVNMAWNRDADCIYLCAEYTAREQTPVVHAAAIKPWGEWIPCAWPHDGLQHDKGSGEELASQYRKQGLKMLPEHATYADGGTGVEAGILDMLDRMKTGRWKVFRTLGGWIGEFRLYHRKDGLIVKLKDDHISASRYGLMMLRHTGVKPSTVPLKRNIRGYS